MKFRESLSVLEKTLKKYKTFFVLIEKEVIDIDTVGNESVLTISYKIKLIDIARLTATSISNLV